MVNHLEHAISPIENPMNHQRIVSMMVHLIAAALVATASLAGAADAIAPNILWVTSEDNSSSWIGCYGNKLARTPRIDALAKEGVVFENAYSNAPVCAVARATM